MSYLTVSIAGEPDPARKAEIDDAVARRGAHISWRTHEVAKRSYASITASAPIDVGDIPAADGDVVYDGAIIALAVFPNVPEALPVLTEVLTGPGRPAAIAACFPVPGGLVLEWDPLRCPVEVVLGTVDVELRRFASGRTAEVLAPLPPEIIATVAARGLQTPEITTRRILELIVTQ